MYAMKKSKKLMAVKYLNIPPIFKCLTIPILSTCLMVPHTSYMDGEGGREGGKGEEDCKNAETS